MKGILKIYSWISTELIEGLVNATGGEILVDKMCEALQHYNMSVQQIAHTMQRAFEESLRTLEATLGGGGWLSPKARKELSFKFQKDIFNPFLSRTSEVSSASLEYLNQQALSECKILSKTSPPIIDFTLYEDEELLSSLSSIGVEGLSEIDIGQIIIDRIKEFLGESSLLVKLLSYRNILLEGLVTHFTIEVSRDPMLSNLVGIFDRKRLENEIYGLKLLIQKNLEERNFCQIGALGRKTTSLITIEKIHNLQNGYREFCGDILERIEYLAEDHREMKEMLSSILSLLKDLKQLQQERGVDRPLLPQYSLTYPNTTEREIADRLVKLVDEVGWKKLPQPELEDAARSLALSYYNPEGVGHATQVLEKAIDAGCKSPSTYFNHFQAAQSAGDYEKAIDSYYMAIREETKLAIVPPNKYKILGVTGRGGMGVVYKAKHLDMGRLVAIKVLLLPEERYPGVRERFIKAAAVAASLRHENIILVYDFDCIKPEYPFMVMEYLDGIDLENKVRHEGPFSLEEGLKVAFKLSNALIYAHEKGVIHRDLKPGNIFLTSEGPKIIDFGLAKNENDKSLTVVGEKFYTLHYSAPEQRQEFSMADTRSDIYSFGKTLYYLFTGDDPFDIDFEKIPAPVLPIIRKSIHKNPDSRYQTVAEMTEALNSVSSGKTLSILVDDKDTDPDIPAVSSSYLPSIKDEKIVLSEGFSWQGDKVFSSRDKGLMMLVPSGSFWMGSEEEEGTFFSPLPDEYPVHEVSLSSYLIDIYAVTNEQYAMFLEDIKKQGGHNKKYCHPSEPLKKDHKPLFWNDPNRVVPDHPVVGVDWWDAYAYSKWAGKELPTEAQWEKAARGADLRKYPWGNESPTFERCNFNKVKGNTSKVSDYPESISPYGCYNMVGNVWEWCQDWYNAKYYSNSPDENPVGPGFGQEKIGRGGSWITPARWIRITARGHGLPSDRKVHLGIRTVKCL